MRANIVETAPTSSKKRKKASGTKIFSTKKKFKENCDNCGKVGHVSIDCRALRKEKKRAKKLWKKQNKWITYVSCSQNAT